MDHDEQHHHSVMALRATSSARCSCFKIAVKKEYPSGIFASRGMAVFTGAAVRCTDCG